MQKVELLAPSGDWDSFSAAINNGADAVYLGLGDFNARAKSTYFNKDNIRETVQYAHLRGTKVYVTINTLVSDEEMPLFCQLVEACISAKVDAYIVQDFGCANLLKTMYPEIVLHASTQMGIHNADGAIFAKKQGFSRIVLSREAKYSDILAIRETGIEIEYFIQGALCVAFSGNCYFSSLAHNMSGNRGKCLQLCRLPYTAFSQNQEVASGYLLSARDLCLLPNIEDLIKAGVVSFKIEGRLRRAGYVAQAVHTYRNAIDNIYDKKTIDQTAEIRKLRQVFSRGDFNYSAYLTAGVPDDIINPINQNHLGLKIGQVRSVERFKDLFKVGISSTHPISSGDGLKFLDKNNVEIDSLGVGNVEKQNGVYYIFTKHRLNSGLDVYLTLDNVMEENVIKNRYLVPVKVDFFAQPDCPIKIRATAEGKTAATVYYESDYICQEAISAPTKPQEICDILSNLDLDVFDTKVSTNLGNVFIPKSALKNARRTLSQELKEAIVNAYENTLPNVAKAQQFLPAKTPKIDSKFTNIYLINEKSDFGEFVPQDNDLVLLSPSVYSVDFVQSSMDKLGKIYKNIGLALPTIANTADIKILDEIVALLPQNCPILINNTYGLKYAKTHYVIAGTDMNIYNSYSIAALQNMGVAEFVWSKETACTFPDIFEFAYGRQTLMHFAHCPFKTVFQNTCKKCSFGDLILKDQAGNAYQILRHKISQCYFTLLQQNITNKKNIVKKFIDLRS